MKFQTRIIAALCCLAVLPLAQAQVSWQQQAPMQPQPQMQPQTLGFEDVAQVVSVAPQVEQFNQPRQECTTGYVTVQQPPQEKSYAGTIIGGIAGGLLGNQIGSGTGRTVATAGGAIAGAMVGDHLSNKPAAPVQTQQPVQNCRMVDNWQTRTNGYAVTYSYRGQTYTSVMPYEPGKTIRVRVSVAPVI